MSEYRKAEKRLKREALKGNDIAASLYSKLRAAELEEDVAAAKTDAWKEFWQEWQPFIEHGLKVHGELSEFVGREAGMTLEDFLWLQKQEPEEK